MLRTGTRRHLPIYLTLIGILLSCAVALSAQDVLPVDSMQSAVTQPSSIAAPAPPTNVTAVDTDNDAGHSVDLTWDLSTDDLTGARSVIMYEIRRSSFPDSGYKKIDIAPSGAKRFTNRGAKEESDTTFFPNDSTFYYRVAALTADSTVQSESATSNPVQATGQWFNSGRIPTLIFVILFTATTLIVVSMAKRGMNFYIRPIGGIEAVDEAIGRATEMGKPILYLCGAGSAEEIATIASMTILSRVSKRIAEYQTQIIVPCYDPVVMTIAQEVVKTGYLDAGRPDAYNEDSVFFVTQAQFAYAAAVNGLMLREKPATNVYMGKFYAESLLFAETGSLAGSIQIAGTDEIAQVPFFVVACDYALIAEEFFAASAYLGREPLLLGSLKAQDYAKIALLLIIIIGAIAVNVQSIEGLSWLSHFKDMFRVTS